MHSSIVGIRLSKPMVYSMTAIFIWTILWPGGQVLESYAVEAEFLGQVVDSVRNDEGRRVIARAEAVGEVIGEKGKKSKGGLFTKVALAAGAAIGVAAYVIAFGGSGKPRPTGGGTPSDSTGIPNDSTFRR